MCTSLLNPTVNQKVSCIREIHISISSWEPFRCNQQSLRRNPVLQQFFQSSSIVRFVTPLRSAEIDPGLRAVCHCRSQLAAFALKLSNSLHAILGGSKAGPLLVPRSSPT